MKKYTLRAFSLLLIVLSMYSCSLDEYNPTEVTGDETLWLEGDADVLLFSFV